MRTHILPIAKQRISDFFTQEDGTVGRKNALTAGTILSSVMIASTLFAPEAAAEECNPDQYTCGGGEWGEACCDPGQYCCSQWDFVGKEKVWWYSCEDDPCPPQLVPWW